MNDEQDESTVPPTPVAEASPVGLPAEPVKGQEPSEATPAAADVPEPVPAERLDEADVPARLRLRRAPRYRPFGVTGAVIGVVAGVILALSFTAASNYSMQTIAGYFAAILGLIGALIGLGIAVLIERRRS